MQFHSVVEKAESVPMSLPRTFVTALERLAVQDGHNNRSAIVRKLVDREMRREFGDDWLQQSLVEASAA